MGLPLLRCRLGEVREPTSPGVGGAFDRRIRHQPRSARATWGCDCRPGSRAACLPFATDIARPRTFASIRHVMFACYYTHKRGGGAPQGRKKHGWATKPGCWCGPESSSPPSSASTRRCGTDVSKKLRTVHWLDGCVAAPSIQAAVNGDARLELTRVHSRTQEVVNAQVPCSSSCTRSRPHSTAVTP